MGSHPIFVFALLAAPAAVGILRVGLWLLAGRPRIVIPWTSGSLPRYSVFAQRRRTRSGSFLTVRGRQQCAFVFWKHCSDEFMDDVLTLFSGVKTVAAYCSLEADGEPWVIAAGKFGPGRRSGEGPYYAPLSSFTGAAVAWVDVSKYLDGAQFLADLRECIENPAVRWKGFAIPAYILGRTRADRVTCSSLIGRAVLRQADSALADALRKALRGRFTYGEITPADLARAAANLGLVPEGMAEPIYTRSLWGLKNYFHPQDPTSTLE